jgi:outer membrane receptor protein involved in Fe transport
MTNSRQLRIVLAASAAAPVLLAAHFAAAATAAPPKDSTSVGEVVVTAEKRSEPLRQVPQSVSVVSGQALSNQQAFSLQDVIAQVPNLSIAQSAPGQARVVLRGVNTNGVASTVAIYMDDTPFGSSSGLANGAVLAADFDTFDVSRVEVLRGPQGTLYGASSLGGVLKYVTTAPQMDAFSLRAGGSVAGISDGREDWRADAVLNAPMGGDGAVRISGYYRQDGGYIDQVGTLGTRTIKDANGDDVYGGRASILIRPTDKISLRLNAYIQNMRAGAPSLVDADPTTGKPLNPGFTHTGDYSQFSNMDYRLFNADLNYDLGLANLTSSTSYATLDQDELTDVSNVALAPGVSYGDLLTAFFGSPAAPVGMTEAQTLGQKKWTQEVRLTSPSNQRIEWMLGGYYTHETGAIAQTLNAFDVKSLASLGLPALEIAHVDSVFQELAGFANATVHVTKALSIQVGGRYSHNKQTGTETVDGLLVGGLTTFTPGNSSEDVFTWSVAPKYEINQHAAVYFRAAKGYRPGGPNVLPPGAPGTVPTSYKADSLISYEAGFKTDWFDHRLSLDASLFYLDWTNVQLFASVSGFGVNTNGGTAVSKGAEFNASARPFQGLNLFAGGSWTNARLTEDTPAITGGLKGDRLPFAPKYTFTLGGDYEHPIQGDYRGFIGATWQLVGPQQPGFDTTYKAVFGKRFEIASYGRLDLRAGVRSGHWTLEAFAKNVTNSNGIIDVNGYGALPNGALEVSTLRPRTVGASLTANF